MKLIPIKTKLAKLISLTKFIRGSGLKLGRGSKAAVISDKKGVPRIFIFDTSALLDLLSKIDEALVDRLTTEEYHNKVINPAGWFIDKIESYLPLDPDFVLSLEKALSEAKKKGWIPFEKIERDLGLA